MPSPPPLIVYQPCGDRGLVFVNNPEFIQSGDTAEGGGVVIHREELEAGRWRVWSSLNNRGGGALHGVAALTNRTRHAVRVRIGARASGAFAEEFPAA